MVRHQCGCLKGSIVKIALKGTSIRKTHSSPIFLVKKKRKFKKKIEGLSKAPPSLLEGGPCRESRQSRISVPDLQEAPWPGVIDKGTFAGSLGGISRCRILLLLLHMFA